jgi:hypothetical protein
VTAGEGEAGIHTGPGGIQIIVPGCGTIHVTDLTEQGAFTELRALLGCILGQPEAVPADVLAAARVADAYAAARLAEQDPSIALDDEARQVIEEPPADLPPAFDELRDEAQEIAEDIERQEGG